MGNYNTILQSIPTVQNSYLCKGVKLKAETAAFFRGQKKGNKIMYIFIGHNINNSKWLPISVFYSSHH
jgi:hypothetical protein